MDHVYIYFFHLRTTFRYLTIQIVDHLFILEAKLKVRGKNFGGVNQTRFLKEDHVGGK